MNFIYFQIFVSLLFHHITIILTAPTKLDEQEVNVSGTLLKGFILYDDTVNNQDGTGRRKGPTPKSVFIAPIIKDLPACAPGYYADSMGRCHRIFQINQTAQLGFLLQKLNAMYGNNDKLIKQKPVTTEGPFQLSIPLEFNSGPLTTTPPPPPSTTEPLTTETNKEQTVELVVMAAEVQIKDEENKESTLLPGAIVTLWKKDDNDTNTTINEETTTESLFPEENTDTTATTEPSTVITTTEEILTTNNDFDTTTESEFTDETIQSSTDINQSTSTEPTLSVQESKLPELITTLLETTLSEQEEPSTPPNIRDDGVTRTSNIVIVTPTPTTSIISEFSESDDDRIHFPSPTQQTINEQKNWEIEEQPSVKWPQQRQQQQQPVVHQPPPPHGIWSWGPWTHPTTTSSPPTTTSPPPTHYPSFSLNFWTNEPHVPDPTIRTRTSIHNPPKRYPATFNGSPQSLYYQELTRQDVNNLFHDAARYHQRTHYRYH